MEGLNAYKSRPVFNSSGVLIHLNMIKENKMIIFNAIYFQMLSSNDYYKLDFREIYLGNEEIFSWYIYI